MPLPSEHREEIEILARRWLGLVKWSRRTERFNQASTVAIVLCGAPLLIFSETLAPMATPVTLLTGGFLWGGWYKIYKVGSARRRQRAEAVEIDTRVAELCGGEAGFEGDEAVLVSAGRPHDPFSDESYG